MDWTQSRLLGRKSTVRGEYEEGWEDADMVFKSSLGGGLKPLELFQSQRWYRMEQCYKIGFAQVAILQKSVDIVWKALQKSHACFTSAQWEILEERLSECRRIQMKLEGFTWRSPHGAMPMERLEGCLWREQLKNIMLEPPGKASEGSYKVCSINSRNEQLSNMLLKIEGASALVKCALREKLSKQR